MYVLVHLRCWCGNPSALCLAEVGADGGIGVQQQDQHDPKEGDNMVKAPDQNQDHHQESDNAAPLAKENEEENHKKDAEDNPGQEKVLVNAKQDNVQPPQAVDGVAKNVAKPLDGEIQKELGARGVPLRQFQPQLPAQNEDKQARDENLDELLPEEIAKEEEKVRVRLAEVEAEKERLEKEMLEKEKLEKERQDEEKLERERQEKERLDKERLRNEQIERQERERVEKENLEAEKLKREKEKADNLLDPHQNVQEPEDEPVRLQQDAELKRNQNEVVPEDQHAPERQKKGGRDLKENVAPQEHVVLNDEKSREEKEPDLLRKRRALDPQEVGGQGLDHLPELKGSDLHAALEAQLLAGGAMVHSRQIKQTTDGERSE